MNIGESVYLDFDRSVDDKVSIVIYVGVDRYVHEEVGSGYNEGVEIKL